jgi:uncharacterized protein YbjT (DUF2867 family)
MKFLVAGATGTVGRQVVNSLVQMGQEVRALTRNPAKANFPEGVEVFAGDLAAPETLAGAFDGIYGMHLITFTGDEYAPLETAAEIVALAENAGVRRVTVLTGGTDGAIVEAIKASRLEWTVLQPVEFMSNALEWVEPIRAEGVVREPFATRRSAMVHEGDIGAVAAAALVNDGHAGKTYPITGPEVLTPPQMIQTLADAAGREIRFEELSVEQARDRWRGQGFDEGVIDYFVWMYGNSPEIGYTVVSTVEQVTGRPARSLAQWAAEHADKFRN